jgi:hypothetical protein
MLRDLKRHRKVETLVQRNRLLEVGFPDVEISLGGSLRLDPWAFKTNAMFGAKLLRGRKPGADATPEIDDGLRSHQIEYNRQNDFGGVQGSLSLTIVECRSIIRRDLV